MKKIVSKVISKDKPSVVLKGEKKTGYILELCNPKDNFIWDVALERVELDAVYELLRRYYAKR